MGDLSVNPVGQVMGHVLKDDQLTIDTVQEFDFGAITGNLISVVIGELELSTVGFDVWITYGGGDMDDPADPVESTGPSNVGTGIVWAVSGYGDTERELLFRVPHHVSKVKFLCPSRAVEAVGVTLYRA